MAESKEIIEFRVKKGILEKIAKNVICENCKIVPREPPIYMSAQRFVICSMCKPKYYLQDLRPFSILENLLPTLPTFCKYQINGCKTIQDLATIESSHEVDCDLRNVSCIYQNCGGRIIYKELEDHFKSSHGINILAQSRY